MAKDSDAFVKQSSNIMREFKSFFNLGVEMNPASLLENYSGIIACLKSIFEFISNTNAGRNVP